MEYEQGGGGTRQAGNHTSRAGRCSFTTLLVKSELILKHIGEHGLLLEARQDRAAKKEVVVFLSGKGWRKHIDGKLLLAERKSV